MLLKDIQCICRMWLILVKNVCFKWRFQCWCHRFASFQREVCSDMWRLICKGTLTIRLSYRSVNAKKMSVWRWTQTSTSCVESNNIRKIVWLNAVRELWHRVAILYNILSQSGSQWSLCKIGVMWSVLGALKIMRTAVFLTFCSLYRRHWGRPHNTVLQLSSLDNTREHTRVLVASTHR